jgi:predicted RNA-binding Zn-ribbon protein involved in translation (DUF1610 family)
VGEIAEMMLDGTLCEGCGVALGGSAAGYPRRCPSCAGDERAERHQQTLALHQQIKKIPCPTCGRKVKTVGLSNHMRDAHGVKA